MKKHIVIILVALTATAFAESLQTGKDRFAWTPSTSSTELATDTFTLEGWINPTELPEISQYGGIMGNWHGRPEHTAWSYGIYRESDGSTSVFLVMRGTNGEEWHVIPSEIIVGTTYHVAVVKDGDEVRMYVNGVFIGDNTSNTMPRSTLGGIALGYHDTGFPDWSPYKGHFTGSLDNLRIWTVARSQEQIVNNMDVALSAATGLAAAWNFNSGQEGVDSTENHRVLDFRGTTFGPNLTSGDSGGSGSTETEEELRARIAELEATNQQLAEGHKQLLEGNQALVEGNETLLKANAELVETNADLVAEGDALSEANNTLQAQVDSLQARVDSVEAANQKLLEDNALVVSLNEELFEENQQNQQLRAVFLEGIDLSSLKYVEEGRVLEIGGDILPLRVKESSDLTEYIEVNIDKIHLVLASDIADQSRGFHTVEKTME